ncbi:MAG: hypothetical protein M0R02_12980 [Bacteroidales bacterium]|nr:hypothetical protein [Bacteroidales bacterium]
MTAMSSHPPPIGAWLLPVGVRRSRVCYRLLHVAPAERPTDEDQWQVSIHDYAPGHPPGQEVRGHRYPDGIRRVREGVWRQDNMNWYDEGRAFLLMPPYIVQFTTPGPGGQQALL